MLWIRLDTSHPWYHGHLDVKCVSDTGFQEILLDTALYYLALSFGAAPMCLRSRAGTLVNMFQFCTDGATAIGEREPRRTLTEPNCSHSWIREVGQRRLGGSGWVSLRSIVPARLLVLTVVVSPVCNTKGVYLCASNSHRAGVVLQGSSCHLTPGRTCSTTLCLERERFLRREFCSRQGSADHESVFCRFSFWSHEGRGCPRDPHALVLRRSESVLGRALVTLP